VVKSTRLGLACTWKSSPFAVSLHDLSDERRFEIGEGLTTGSVFEQSRKIKISLVVRHSVLNYSAFGNKLFTIEM
jgi:hypothetical protein